MVAYDPLDPEIQADPHPWYRRLRDESPVHFVPAYGCWFLSRFRDIWREEQDQESYTIRFGQMPSQLLVPSPSRSSGSSSGSVSSQSSHENAPSRKVARSSGTTSSGSK